MIRYRIEMPQVVREILHLRRDLAMPFGQRAGFCCVRLILPQGPVGGVDNDARAVVPGELAQGERARVVGKFAPERQHELEARCAQFQVLTCDVHAVRHTGANVAREPGEAIGKASHDLEGILAVHGVANGRHGDALAREIGRDVIRRVADEEPAVDPRGFHHGEVIIRASRVGSVSLPVPLAIERLYQVNVRVDDHAHGSRHSTTGRSRTVKPARMVSCRAAPFQDETREHSGHRQHAIELRVFIGGVHPAAVDARTVEAAIRRLVEAEVTHVAPSGHRGRPDGDTQRLASAALEETHQFAVLPGGDGIMGKRVIGQPRRVLAQPRTP